MDTVANKNSNNRGRFPVRRKGNTMKTHFFAIAAMCPLIPACTSVIHKTNTFDAETGVQTLAIDARQRVVTVSPFIGKDNKDDNSNNGGTGDKPFFVTCAEPSPDALSALSTSVGGSVQDPNVIANFAVAATESAASIGLRTQSIQLLRDGMYRLCEAYAGHAITSQEYNRQQRRYQDLMLSLLAIEQLTGAVVAQQVGLGGGTATTSVGDNAAQAAADLTKAKTAVTDAQTALSKAEGTQASDEEACSAAGSDPKNKSCTAASADAASVKEKQADLETANTEEETAQQELVAARATLKAAATGAKVNFSGPSKTSQLTDASAHYVAEATRTIVSTTLIASFAQEECSRLWDELDTPNGPNLVARANVFDTVLLHRAGGTLLQELVDNCGKSQSALFARAAMLTPDYSGPPPALKVLGADKSIPLSVGGGFVDLRIVGGTPPYEAVVDQAYKPELGATILPAKGLVYTVRVDRPAGASNAGSADVTLVDANNEYIDIPITLVAKSGAAPGPQTPGTTAAVKISEVASSGGKITVKFTVDKSVQVSKITMKATNAQKPTDELSQVAAAGVTEIDIPGCTDGQTYNVTLDVTVKSGQQPPEATGSTKCVAAAAAPTPAAPAAPTQVVAKSAAATFVVGFTPPKDDGQGAIDNYTATATNAIKKGETPLKQTSADGKATSITLTGCTVGDKYAIAVFATRNKVDGKPGTTSQPCAK